MIKDGKDTALGNIVSAVSIKVAVVSLQVDRSDLSVLLQWKALTVDERAYYEELANADKRRYDRECAVR